MLVSQKTIKILHVVPGLGPGGMELKMAQVINGLDDKRINHSIICLKGEPEIKKCLPERTEVYCLYSKPNEPKLPLRLSTLIRTIRPNAIHARNWGAWPDTAIGRLMVWPIIPMIFSFHGLGRAGYMPLRRRITSKILTRITPHLFTVSRQSRDMLVKDWGWPYKRTMIIPNGVDTNKFFPEQRAKSKKFVIGSVGNLRKVKNHALILKACKQLMKHEVDFELRIAGEGNERERLNALAKSLGIDDRVNLVGRKDNIPSFLNQLDIFVLSSNSEQHPNALTEAAACGIASIATRVGCVEDLLDYGRCGRIIEPEDDQGLFDALLEFANNERLRQRIAKKGLEHIRKNFSLQVMLERYKKLYFKVASERIVD